MTPYDFPSKVQSLHLRSPQRPHQKLQNHSVAPHTEGISSVDVSVTCILCSFPITKISEGKSPQVSDAHICRGLVCPDLRAPLVYDKKRAAATLTMAALTHVLPSGALPLRPGLWARFRHMAACPIMCNRTALEPLQSDLGDVDASLVWWRQHARRDYTLKVTPVAQLSFPKLPAACQHLVM